MICRWTAMADKDTYVSERQRRRTMTTNDYERRRATSRNTSSEERKRPDEQTHPFTPTVAKKEV